MKKISILFLIILLLIFDFMIANFVDARKVKELPREVIIPLENINIFNISKKIKEGMPWVVYSDREKNQTYMSYKAMRLFKKASFLQSFYVLEEKENYLHIVKDPKLNSNSELSSFSESYGWISKRNLLLWNHCLVGKESLVNQKAMVLNTLDYLQKKGASGHKFLKFRKGLASNSSQSEHTYKLFNFFFIYKKNEDKEKYLLGKDPLFNNDDDVSNIITGWAPKGRLVLWDTRIVIEPNWDKPAIKQRKRGLNAKFFLDKPAAKDYAAGKKVNNKFIFWDEKEPSWQRQIGEWRRFPLLNIFEDTNILQAGVMGQIKCEDKVLTTPEQLAKYQHKTDYLLKKRRRINLIFAVDATRSMSDFFIPMSQEIVNVMKSFKAVNDFYFGAVIYRDLSESEDRQRNIKQLTTDYEEVANFLNNTIAGDIDNNTDRESVYYGLQGALRGTGIDEDSTNIIVLIGDTGNHGNNVSQSEIVNLLVKNSCNYIAIQVNNRGYAAYDDFIDQNKAIVKQVAERIYKESNKYKNINEYTQPKLIQDQNNNLIYRIQGGPITGVVRGLREDEEYHPASLKSEIRAIIFQNEAALNEMAKGKHNLVEVGDSLDQTISKAEKINSIYVSEFTPNLIYFLKQSGLSKDDYDIIKKEKYQLYLKLIAPITVEGQTHPLFKRSLLLEYQEFSNLLNSLYKLSIYGRTNEGNERKQMYETWKEILKLHLGDKQDVDSYGLNKIHRIVVGLPSRTKALRNRTLKEITNKRLFKSKDFNNYVNQITDKTKRLQNIIRNENYKYMFRSNEERYYWISEDLLP